MSFTSLEFLVFFTLVVGVFFAIPDRVRWIYLLAVSYFFYMWMDPRYVILLLTTTLIVYLTGLPMGNASPRAKKALVAISVISNLGILFVFKYFNFFNTSMRDLFTAFGIGYDIPSLQLLLPVGISFYTFQALSYTIDVYRGTRPPERHFGMFALYVSFFPTILSGPIERSTRLLPQLYRKVSFDYERVVGGLMLMGWGFFQKLIIADRLAMFVNAVYANPRIFSGVPLLLATYFFVFQVYCDFSGYTDIAIGTAQVMGYELMPNFRRPFFARSIGELWRRWHISLISWFRDYLYIPLGGNRGGAFRWHFNTLLVFVLSGLWHGAQWTFVTWGALNGVLIILSRLTDNPRTAAREFVFGLFEKTRPGIWLSLTGLAALAAMFGGRLGLGLGLRAVAVIVGLFVLSMGIISMRGDRYRRFLSGMKSFWMVLLTFHLFTLGAVFFRSATISDAWYILTHFAGGNIAHVFLLFKPAEIALMLGLVALLNIIHLIQERKGSIRAMVRSKPWPIRWALYYLMVMSIFLGMQKTSQFIYFNF